MGESIVKASLGGTYSELYITKFPVRPVSTFISRPSKFTTRNHHVLQPIVTRSYPWTGWECFVDGPPMDTLDSFANFWLYVITEQPVPNSPVCSKVITSLTTSANINVAPGPFATNI